MALVVFLRGINVGGHRRFRPSILAKELSGFDVVNVGAAGTLVVRRPGSRENFRAELSRRLPFAAEAALCDGRDLLQLEKENPFGIEQPHPDMVRFVSILSKAGRCTGRIPFYASARRRMVCARNCVQEAIRLRNLSPPHEDHWVSRPNRQALRRTGNHAQLEHDTRGSADFENETGPATGCDAGNQFVCWIGTVL